MNTYDPVVERRLNQAANRWKWLRFFRLSATFGVGVLGLMLLVGVGKVLGWLPAAIVLGTMTLGLVLTPIVVLGLMLVVGISRQERARLARAWEQVHAPLLDRLNTLVYLETEKETPASASFTRKIKDQARTILARSWSLPIPFPARQALGRGLIFLALLAATALFYGHYRPWVLPPVVLQPPSPPPEPPLDLPPPESVVEQEKPWGEVRITRPGADLAVTPAEDVPLQIEAATNRPLKSVAWFTAVNGGEETAHALPPPEEPLFAAYQPVLKPKDLNLSEWDVVTYHARGTTQDGLIYKSEVYFVEVRPFREEILKATGGPNTELYEILNELTGMIEQQQEVIRRTHRGEETRDGQPSLPEADRGDLARAEDDLAKSAEHLAARLVAATRNHPAAHDPVARLGEAGTSLKDAAGRLRDDAVTDAERRQREALARLIAARKRFQQAIADHPDAFPKPQKEPLARQPAPGDMLDRIAEFRDERRAAREFVEQSLAQQKQIDQKARSAPQTAPALTRQQEALAQALDEFRKQHPQAFQGAEKPSTEANQALKQAAQALRQGAPKAAKPLARAAEKLDALNQALQNEARRQQLADAYTLKEMLDREIGEFARVEKDPAALAPEQVRRTIAETKETVRQLQDVAEKAPTRDDFGTPLRQALNPQSRADLEKECTGLGEAANPAAAGKAAGSVKQRLEKIAKAFERSQPPSLAGRPEANPLQPGAQQALDRGLAQLEGLSEEGRQPGGTLTPSQDQKQRAEAVANLETGIFGRLGHNDRTVALVRQLQRDLLDKHEPVEARLIAKLRDDLQERRVEVSTKDAPKPDDPQATHIDPTRLPPAYRKAIETYFEKLSAEK